MWRAQNLLELVQSYVCCINLPSLAGARYILTFIDDFCCFTWVFFLKSKNLVFENFKDFNAFDENKCGRPIKFSRSDNGGEYVNQPFEEYLLRSGIDWQQPVPRTPQQNGVGERNNWTLVEMDICIL
jgi:transposase InsO family protein